MEAEGARGGKRVSRGRVTQRSTWFGGEGKAETQPWTPCRSRGQCGATREALAVQATASHRHSSHLGLSRHHSLAHQASARLNILAAKAPPFANVRCAAGRGHRLSHIPPVRPE